MASLPFTKLNATGNDFVFIDARRTLPTEFSTIARAELAKRICDRHFGIGADGLVFVEQGSAPALLKWDFYNNDGSHAEMCGNASRCMGRWAAANLDAKSVSFETAAGLVTASTEGNSIASSLEYLKLSFTALPFERAGRRAEAQLVNTGVPHAVFEAADLSKRESLVEVINALRFHPLAGQKGANVTFLQKHSAESFSTVTFERGVEDYTLSCGTGVLAAAAVGLLGTGKTRAKVKAPGGELEVRFGEKQGAVLVGPADLVFEGNLREEIAR